MKPLKHSFYTICLIAAAFVPLFGQEAKIMIVEKPDSVRLVRAYREYKDAQVAWEKIKNEVAKNYTWNDGKPLEGWDKVQFSADFRAIVPDFSQYAYHTPCTSMVWPSGFSGNVWSAPVGTGTGTTLPNYSTEGWLTLSGSTFDAPKGSDLSVKSDLVVKEKRK